MNSDTYVNVLALMAGVEVDRERYLELVELLYSLAEDRFGEKFYLESKIWTDGDFELEAVHGVIDTERETALVCDRRGNIVFERRRRVSDSSEKVVESSEVVRSSEDISLEEWKDRRMNVSE